MYINSMKAKLAILDTLKYWFFYIKIKFYYENFYINLINFIMFI